MEWSMIFEYINPELIVVVIACWIIGYVFKQTPFIPDWSIVYLVGVVAIVFVCLIQGFTVQAIIQGILCGAVAVFGHQAVKQTAKAAGESNE